MKKILLTFGVIAFSLLAMFACATSPLGRNRVLLVSDQQMDALGQKAFEEMKQKTPIDSDPAIQAYVRCIALPIIEAAKNELSVAKWDIVVFNEPSANAFALPGGEIGVHTGLLSVAKTDAQLAAVIGHEVGHVIARHGAERMSETLMTQGGLALIDAFLMGRSMQTEQKDLILGALGMGAQIGVILPHSRTQESEADLIGLELMARAGFDPRESVQLWKNMIQASSQSGHGEAPPEWLSTHPASENRISSLQSHLPQVLSEYQKFLASGHHPSCRRS